MQDNTVQKRRKEGRGLFQGIPGPGLLLATGLLFSTPLLASEKEGEGLRLRGQGSFRFAGLVPVYSAAYYEGALSAKLEVTYHRDFSAEQIIKGGNALLRRNLRAEEWEAVSAPLAELNRAYKDVRAGDKYVLLREEGKGLGLSLNGEPPVWIACETLSKVYFRIWTGERPMSERLRDELLGKGRGSDS